MLGLAGIVELFGNASPSQKRRGRGVGEELEQGAAVWDANKERESEGRKGERKKES